MPSSATSELTNHYLVIKGMKITRANAMPCPYLAGLPSMHGVVGMGRYLVNHTLKGSGLAFHSIAVCISAFSMSGSQQKYACHSLQDVRKHQNLRIITARDSWFTADVVVRVNSLKRKSVDDLNDWLEDHRHLDAFYKLRFCGGHVLFVGGCPNVLAVSANELSEVCHYLDGFFIADRIELCRSERQAEEDALDTLLRLIQESKAEGHGWLAPLMVGFIPLELPVLRKNTRASLPHSHSEPVLGLGRLFSAQAVKSELGISDSFFWQSSPDRKFVVAGSM